MFSSRETSALIDALQARGIADLRVLAAIGAVPRELFVEPEFSSSAYEDTALPIHCGQTISQPFIVAYMTEKLDLQPHHEVLEVGTGSGYQAAVLAQLCRHVYTLERYAALHEEAKVRFRRLRLDNITAAVGDGWAGWPEPRAFDRIIVTAAAREAPQPLLDQLKIGGRMIIPLGPRLLRQRLVQFDRTERGIEKQELLAVRFVPLVHGVSVKAE
jgi:protein-L-isoaspartate(D-aspartate) O-methyltransferase